MRGPCVSWQHLGRFRGVPSEQSFFEKGYLTGHTKSPSLTGCLLERHWVRKVKAGIKCRNTR